MLHKSFLDAGNMAKFSYDEKYLQMWNKVATIAKEAESTWEKAIHIYEDGLAAVPLNHNDLLWWKKELENVKDYKHRISSISLSYVANKSTVLGVIAYRKAYAAPSEEDGPLWDKAIIIARKTEAAWEDVLRNKKARLATIPIDRSDLRKWWTKQLEVAEDAKNQSIALPFELIHNKARSVAVTLGRQTEGIPIPEKGPLYAQRRIEVNIARKEAIEAFQKGLDSLPPDRHDLKEWWIKKIKRVEDGGRLAYKER